MLSIDFELEQSLQAIAQREHSSPNEIIKKLLSQYLLQRQSATAFVKSN
jgi:predicted transcriptional regulator